MTSRLIETPGGGRGPEVRAARPEDLDAVARIWHEGWLDGHAGRVPDALVAARDPETFGPRAAERLASTLVCTVDGEVAGFVVTIGDEVEQVYVDRGWRGRGVAGALLSAAEARIAAEGHSQAWLAVVAENATARAFYERSGWRDEGGFSYDAETAEGAVPVPCRRYVVDLPQPGPSGWARS